MSHEGEARPAATGRASVTQPRTPVQGSQGRLHSTRRTVASPVPASSFRRRAPRIDVWDVIGWVLFTAAIAGILLTFCMLTTLAWPS
jgi:hypothetical protein